MPYVYQSAKARSKNNAQQWSSVDLSNVDLNDIYRLYSKVYVTLTHTSLAGTMYLDMDKARELIPVDTHFRTIITWLASLGNATLPTDLTLPSFTPKMVKYADVYRAGYKVRKMSIGRHPDSQVSDGDKNDLIISRSDVDFRQYWRSCLVTVNGMFHRVGASTQGLYVLDGARSGRIANDNQLGLVSFRDISAMEVVPITHDMIYKTHPDQALRNYAYIKLPKPSLNKTVLLVLGGYLHVLDDVYRQIGESAVRVDFNNYNLADRILESINRINLDPLKLSASAVNDRMFTTENLYSDATLRAYLTLPQSFLIILDTNSLYVRKRPVEFVGIGGRFLAPTPFDRLPLFSALGRCYDYRVFVHDGRALLTADSNFDEQYLYETAPWKNNYAIDDTTYPAEARLWAPAYMMEIGRT